jgi:hypothetical protein
VEQLEARWAPVKWCPLLPRLAHGPFVDDDSEWFIPAEAIYQGLGLVELNPEKLSSLSMKTLASQAGVWMNTPERAG